MNLNGLGTLICKKTKRLEILLLTCVISFFMLFFSEILFALKSMLSHDSIRWYGVFHFFFDSMLDGNFPYWDPYDHCGQPFYYNLGILRIYEPITVGFAFLYKIFGASLLTIYHWEYMARIIIAGIGVYLCYRQTNRFLVSNIVVFGVFLFSSFTATCLRQNGVLYTIFWAPWVLYFLLRLLKDFNIYNIIGLASFVGFSLTSYQGGYLLTYLFIFILTLLINKRDILIGILKNVRKLAMLIPAFFIIILLVLPLLTVYIEQDKIVPIARLDSQATITKGVVLDYSSVAKAGSHSNAVDFLELFVPAIAKGFFPDWFLSVDSLKPSECFLYIGIIPLFLALIGILFVKTKYRINFLITLAAVGLLMLGPRGIMHSILYILFYPLHFLRHMHLFSGFFIFTLLYFVGQGCDFTIDKIISYRSEKK